MRGKEASGGSRSLKPDPLGGAGSARCIRSAKKSKKPAANPLKTMGSVERLGTRHWSPPTSVGKERNLVTAHACGRQGGFEKKIYY